ncbi:hypothetical protein K239x_36080 [Planctomycetes bacterium K23_9]|uniref:HAMP domain-containing protein n=2 Tax=Stieleria marina TaxID=1930275 RepID=A0A517NWX3_9BACT|nr:hypothetical protein K239x_36080 [Planctomycetes bacterium K23_9]
MHWTLLLVCLVSISMMVRLMMSVGEKPFGEAFINALSAQAPLMAVMVILMPVFLRDTLKLSNRFAGPMYRLRTVLEEMANGGEGSKIKFRVGDFWQSTAGDFNTVLDEVNRLKSRNAELETEVAELRSTASV